MTESTGESFKNQEIQDRMRHLAAASDSPFPGLTFAGELDDLESAPLEIPMNADWIGYINVRILAMIQALISYQLRYLRFLPNVEEGCVILVPTKDAQAYGAEEVKYSETEKGATVNLRLAVKRFNLQKSKDRVRIFAVFEKKAPSGERFLAFRVKESGTRPARKMKKSENTPEEASGTAGSTPK